MCSDMCAPTGPAGYPGERTVVLADLRPTVSHTYGHDVYFQNVASPKGMLFIAHGCVHGGNNYFPKSDTCPGCVGLPEEISHTIQAMKMGLAGVCSS